MRMGRGALWIPPVFMLGACAVTHSVQESAPPAGHHFGYSIDDREQVHLVQVFDDGSKTYLQFEDKSDGVRVVRVADDAPILYQTEQRYVILNGVFDAVRVTLSGHSVVVINTNASPLPAITTASPTSLSDLKPNEVDHMSLSVASDNPQVSPSQFMGVSDWASNYAKDRVPASVGIPESLQTMHSNLRVTLLQQEIASLEERVRELTRQIEAAHSEERGRSIYVRTTAGLPQIALTFADNSDRVVIDEDLRLSLGVAARAANRIYLHGHTDAYMASTAGTSLAIGRAVQVRALLVSLDVDPERIRLFYRGAGNFAANNSTEEGKALNRRVEVELRKW